MRLISNLPRFLGLLATVGIPSSAYSQAAQSLSDGAGVSPPAVVTTTGRSGIDTFSAVQVDGSEIISNSGIFQQLGGLEMVVRTNPRSTMLITFSAECTVRSPTVDAAIVVEIQVNGVRPPGFGSIVFCSNKDFYYETHSFQWVSEAGARRPQITVHARTLDADANTEAILGDRILTVMYLQR